MAFKHYLEEEDDKPYFTTNSLGYYYDKMEGFAEKVEQAAKTLNVTKEEVQKNIAAYIEQNKNELDQRLAQWDGKLETFDSSVETLLSEWVDDGTLTHVIDTSLIDQKIAPVTAQLEAKATKIENKVAITKASQNLNDVEIIAHRGFSLLYPQNSIYAAKKSIELGANPEFDISFTLDNEPVIFHDKNISVLTNGAGNIAELNYAYLATLDAGAKFNSYFTGTRIPKLTEYLKALTNAKHIYAEIKDERTPEHVQNVTNAIVDYGFESRATIQTFNYPNALPTIRAISKTIRVGVLVWDQAIFENYANQARNDSNSMMLIPKEIATLANLRLCQQYGLEVGVYTIVDHATLMNLYDIGYRKFMCDKPLEVIR